MGARLLFIRGYLHPCAQLLLHVEIFSCFTHSSTLIESCRAGGILRINRKAGSTQITMIQFTKGVLQKSQAKSSAPPLTSNGQAIYPAWRTSMTQRATNRLIARPGKKVERGIKIGLLDGPIAPLSKIFRGILPLILKGIF